MDPRVGCDDLGRMVCFHGRYNLGDEHDFRVADYDSWGELKAAIAEEENLVAILPLFLYDHSGITMSTSSFSCQWDSGQVGFIYATREAVLEAYGKKRISKKTLRAVEASLVAEVKTYDQYLTGDVWGYVIEDDQGKHLDSCWGFFGREFCEQQANRQLHHWGIDNGNETASSSA